MINIKKGNYCVTFCKIERNHGALPFNNSDSKIYSGDGLIFLNLGYDN